jgi:hypothetical protein
MVGKNNLFPCNKFWFKQRNNAGDDNQSTEHIKCQDDCQQQSHHGLKHQF